MRRKGLLWEHCSGTNCPPFFFLKEPAPPEISPLPLHDPLPIPSAAEFPSFDVASTETPTPLNPLGAKGIGESGTVGSMPAVQNAVVDALSHLGVRHIDTPLKIGRAHV